MRALWRGFEVCKLVLFGDHVVVMNDGETKGALCTARKFGDEHTSSDPGKFVGRLFPVTTSAHRVIVVELGCDDFLHCLAIFNIWCV